MIKQLILCSVALAASGVCSAQNFDEHFEDKTLRLDYLLGGDANKQYVALDKQISTEKWAGRRHNLKELPRLGNGQITVRDAATGDTLYRNSFSTLFQEWLVTDEAKTTNRSFHASLLTPYPKREAIIDICLLDMRHEPIAQMSHRFDPKDILVKNRSGFAALPHKYVHKGADPSRAIDFAFLAEGYTEAEMDSFYRHAEMAAREILSYEPYKSYADRINFVAVASPSKDSDVSVPKKNQWRDTAFKSNYSTFYSDRYLTSEDMEGMHDALTNIPYEHIIVLVNSEEYGGGGIFNSYMLSTAKHKFSRPVIVHELGHSFGGLGDEYFYENDVMTDSYPKDVEPWEPNITTLVDFDSKWKHLLKKGTPVPTPIARKDKYPLGVFEGGGYSTYGVYRPADECRMRNNTYPTFCPACTDALEKLILFYTE